MHWSKGGQTDGACMCIYNMADYKYKAKMLLQLW